MAQDRKNLNDPLRGDQGEIAHQQHRGAGKALNLPIKDAEMA